VLVLVSRIGFQKRIRLKGLVKRLHDFPSSLRDNSQPEIVNKIIDERIISFAQQGERQTLRACASRSSPQDRVGKVSARPLPPSALGMVEWLT